MLNIDFFHIFGDYSKIPNFQTQILLSSHFTIIYIFRYQKECNKNTPLFYIYSWPAEKKIIIE
jgi:hypothetical protein